MYSEKLEQKRSKKTMIVNCVCLRYVYASHMNFHDKHMFFNNSKTYSWERESAWKTFLKKISYHFSCCLFYYHFHMWLYLSRSNKHFYIYISVWMENHDHAQSIHEKFSKINMYDGIKLTIICFSYTRYVLCDSVVFESEMIKLFLNNRIH